MLGWNNKATILPRLIKWTQDLQLFYANPNNSTLNQATTPDSTHVPNMKSANGCDMNMCPPQDIDTSSIPYGDKQPARPGA